MWRAIRRYLITGLLVLAPTAITITIFYRLLNWVDSLLGRHLRFEAFEYHRIPGLGLVTTLLLLFIVGWFASWIGARPLLGLWDSMLQRIPGVNLVYGSTKSLGEAFLGKAKGRDQPFKQVVLVQWPMPGLWRVGFITGRPSPEIKSKLGDDIEVVFVPHTPNPASGFVHYVPAKDLVQLDWPIEDGLKVIVSGGVVQPGTTVVIPKSGDHIVIPSSSTGTG
jgi:uncharacterized membrane protein